MTAPTATLPYSATIEEVIRLTGLSKTKLYALLAEGKLQGKKHGRRTLVMMDGVRAYVDALPKARFGTGGIDDATGLEVSKSPTHSHL